MSPNKSGKRWDRLWKSQGVAAIVGNLSNQETHELLSGGADYIALFDYLVGNRDEENQHGGVLLEIGPGIGRQSIHFAKRCDTLIVVEHSKSIAKQCRKNMKALGITNIAILRDLRDMDGAEQIDNAFSFNAMIHCTSNELFAISAQILYLMKGGASFVFDVPNLMHPAFQAHLADHARYWREFREKRFHMEYHTSDRLRTALSCVGYSNVCVYDPQTDSDLATLVTKNVVDGKSRLYVVATK